MGALKHLAEGGFVGAEDADDDSLSSDTPITAGASHASGAYGEHTGYSGMPSQLKGALSAFGTREIAAGAQAMDAARQPLLDAASKLSQAYAPQPGGVNVPLLAWASAMLRPTKTGSFFESLGAAGEAAAPAIQQQRQIDQQRRLGEANAKFQAAQVGYSDAKDRMSIGLQLAKAAAAGKKYLSHPTIGVIDTETGKVVVPAPDPLALAYRKAQINARVEAGKPTEVQKDALSMGLEPGTLEWNEFIRKSRLKSNGEGFAYTPDNVLGQELGVPVFKDSPYKGMTDKGAEKLYTDEVKAAEKAAADDMSAISAAEDTQRLVDEFLKLNEEVETGGLLKNDTVANVRGAFNDKLARMQAITSKLAPEGRIPGTGAVSDFDAGQLVKATLGVGVGREANKQTGEFIKAIKQREAEMLKFKQDYRTANGIQRGWEQYWKAYAAANPVFDPGSPDTPKLNKGRVGYKDYFKKTFYGASPSGNVDPGKSAADPTKSLQDAAAAELERRKNERK